MQYSSTLPGGTDLFNVGISQAMHAEQQVSRIIPQMFPAICSAELIRILRRALAISVLHQQQLAGSFGTLKTDCATNAIDDLEKQITAITVSTLSSNINDMTYTLLVTKMIQHKIGCYEQALDINEASNSHNPQRVLGATLSDETATVLFLQELSQRLITRQFPDQGFSA